MSNRIKSSPERIDLFLKKNKVTEWNYKKLSSYRLKNEITRNLDLTVLAVLASKNLIDRGNFNNYYNIIDPEFKIVQYRKQVLIPVLKKHDLLKYEQEFDYFCYVFTGLYNMAIWDEKYSKVYLERDKQLKELEKIYKEGIVQITFKSRTKKAHIRDTYVLRNFLTYVHNLRMHLDIKFPLINKPEKKAKGRPKSHKTQALRTISFLIYSYLDLRGELVPEDGNRTSDKRRWFIADLLLALGMILDHEYTAKEYVDSLIKY